jgi:hypothetical protein
VHIAADGPGTVPCPSRSRDCSGIQGAGHTQLAAQNARRVLSNLRAISIVPLGRKFDIKY